MRNAICAAKITSFLHKSKQNKRNCLSQACKTLSEGQNGPQANGWVVIYGNCTSWNGANFMVVKLNDEGDEMWRKQICEPDFKCSGLSVEADAKKAIIFYTCDMEYDSNWEPIVGEGGMFVMCVDLTNGEDPVGIQQISTTSASKIIDLQGRIADSQQAGQTYIVDGKLTMIKK